MNPNIIDFVVALTFIISTYWEVKRGFGKAIFDAPGLIIAVYAARNYYLIPAKVLTFVSPDTANLFGFVIIFGILAAVSIMVASYLKCVTQISLDPFDPVMAAIVGLAAAVVFCHVLMYSVFLVSNNGTIEPGIISHSLLGDEFLSFKTANALWSDLAPFRNPTLRSVDIPQ